MSVNWSGGVQLVQWILSSDTFLSSTCRPELVRQQQKRKHSIDPATVQRWTQACDVVDEAIDPALSDGPSLGYGFGKAPGRINSCSICKLQRKELQGFMNHTVLIVYYHLR